MTEFIHLPQQGISFGVKIHDGTAFLAASFVNFDDINEKTGKPDQFNKRQARLRIEGRINKMIENGHHKLGVAEIVPDELTEFSLAKRLRDVFIPNGVEDISKFSVIIEPLSGEQRIYRLDRTSRYAIHQGNSPSALDVISGQFVKAIRI